MSLTLPVLFLDDAVVLPGMVVPVDLTDQAQAAIDAARAARPGAPEAGADDPLRILLVPRIDGRTGVVGAVAEITQIGRLPSGEPVAVLRATARGRIGTGVMGPGAALWVEVEPLPEAPATGRARELAGEYKTVLTSILQQRGAWQVVDAVARMKEPTELADAAGYASWVDLPEKLRLLETPDVVARLEFLLERARTHLAELEVSEKIATDVREGMEKSQREYLLRQQLSAIRKELGELSGDPSDEGTATGRGSRPPTCPRPCAPPRCARPAGSSAPANSRRRPAGSAPGSTPSWSCPGAPAARTPPTSLRPARSWTPTTPGSTT